MRLVCESCGQPFEARASRRRYCTRACGNKHIAKRHSAKANDPGPRPIVWSCGGGVDSTAIAVMICQGTLPPPEYAVMVDVGYEPASTWQYVRETLQPQLAKVGVTLHILPSADTTNTALVQRGHCVLPAFIRKPDGGVGKLDTHCSQPWKAAVARRWLKAQGVKSCEQWLGIAADEQRRARPSDLAWTRLSWPLIDHGLARADCVHLIGSAGWPLPERTSCYLCPQHNDWEWHRLAARSPADFELACLAEERIQTECPSVYLHRSAKPLRQAIDGSHGSKAAEPPKDELVLVMQSCNESGECVPAL